MKEVHEKLKYVNEHDDPESALRELLDPAVKTVLRFVFDRSLKINLPDSPPPVAREKEDEDYPETLSSAYKLLALFVDNNDMSPMRREGKFFELLKTLSEEEAAILIAGITRDNEEAEKYHFDKLYPNITEEVVRSVVTIKS